MSTLRCLLCDMVLVFIFFWNQKHKWIVLPMPESISKEIFQIFPNSSHGILETLTFMLEKYGNKATAVLLYIP